MKTHTIFSQKLLRAGALVILALNLFLPEQVNAQTVLNNSRLRIGTGSENSVNTSGNLQQPFYYNSVQALWRKLTYSTIPLDNAFAVDGVKTNVWNTNGTIVQNPALSGQVINTGGYVSTGTGTGYGTIVSTGQITIAGKNLEIENTYKLLADKSYIEVKVKVRNTSASTLENVRIWIGTRDDWVGGTDQPTKQKGNLVDGEFVKITSQATRAVALKVLSGAEGILFYTNSDKGNTIIQGCCYWSNVIYQNPQTCAIEATNDGSYGFYVRFNDLAPNATDDFTWYYAAGELAEIDDIIREVAEVSGDVSDITYSTATFKATSTLDATGYWVVVPRNATAPVAAEIKAGTDYGTVILTAHGSNPMTANVETTFNISGLSPGTAYDLYFVSEEPSPAFSAVLRVQFSSAAYTVPVVSSTTAISAISGNSAASGGTVGEDGGQPVTARGICWNTSGNPVIPGNLTSDGSGTGTFTSELTGLTHTATYYARAYATNNIGTAYGPQLSFTTLTQTVPSVSTSALSTVTQTSAESGGNVTSDGGLPISVRGICWNTAGSPTLLDNMTENGAGTGIYTSEMTNLLPGTLYYMRSYATNSQGTSYGNQLSFTSLKYSQIITFETLPDKTYGDGDFIPEAFASSGLEVSFASSNTDVATIVDGKLHVVGAGTSVITASQPGNDTHYAAVAAEQIMQVEKALLTAVADDKSRTYGYANPLFTITYSGFKYGEDNSVIANPPLAASAAGVASNTGTYPITVSGGSHDNYDFGPVNGILTVTTTELTIIADDISKTYGEANPELSISYSGFVNDEDASVLDIKPVASTLANEISAAGEYTISPAGAADGNYSLVYEDGALKVIKKSILISANDLTKSYGDPVPGLTVTYSGLVNGDTQEVLDTPPLISTGVVQVSPAGNYPIVVSGAEDNNYSFIYEEGDFTVTPRDLHITANDKIMTYGDELPALTWTIEGFVPGDDESIFTSPVETGTTATTASDAGNYLITASGAVAPGYYDIHFNSGNLLVEQAELVISAENKIMTYGDPMPELTFAITGFKNGDSEEDVDTRPVISTPAVPSSPRGNYPVVVSDAVDNNYVFRYNEGLLTVNTKDLFIQANNVSKKYGEELPGLTWTITGFVPGDGESIFTSAVEISTPATASSNAGSYPVTVSGAEADDYYTLQFSEGTLIIEKAELTITADDMIKAYGDPVPGLTVTYSGLVNSDTHEVLDTPPVISTGVVQSSPAGNYPIAVSGADDNNYFFVYEEGDFAVTTRDLYITANDKTMTYGDELPALTWSIEGFVPGDDESIFTSPVETGTMATTSNDAGNYLITASGAVAPGYYNIHFNSGNLLVEQAELVISAENKIMTYGDPMPELTFAITGFKNGDSQEDVDTRPVISTPAVLSSPRGNYPVVVSDAVDNNYVFSYNEGLLTVNTKDLFIQANNESKMYGEELPGLTWSITGFVPGDGESIFTSAVEISTPATASSDAGSYPVTVSGAEADDFYTIQFSAGTLLIEKAELTITADDHIKAYGDPVPGLTVTYSGLVNGDTHEVLNTPPVISTGVVQASPIGNYPIAVSGADDNNYAIDYEEGRITVNPKDLYITADNKTIVYGGDFPELSYTIAGFVMDDDESKFSSPVEINTSAHDKSDAGIYNISVSGALAADYYTIHFNEGSLVIDKATLHVMAENQTRPYAEENAELVFSYNGFVNGENPGVLDVEPVATTEASKWTPTGLYAITLENGADQNYRFVYQEGILTIAKADQIIDFVTIPEGMRANTSHSLLAQATSNLDIEFSVSDAQVAITGGDQLQILREGTLVITASQAGDNNWNPATASQTLAVSPSFDNSDFLMSPNGDGVNDFWHINYLEEYGNASVLVYNRWGKKVFESNDYANDWDGNYNGSTLPTGAYYFIINSDTRGLIKGVINIVY